MTTTPTTDLLLALQLKLPTHTHRAVKLHAAELKEPRRTEYLERVLGERERSEGAAG